MAATRLIALHVNKGKTVAQCLADRTDYSQNAEKTGGGYVKWAKIFNLKQAAEALLFVQDHNLCNLAELTEQAEAHTEKSEALLASIKADEARLQEIAVLKTHIISYAKSKDIFDKYQASSYRRDFYEAYREALTLRRAASKAFREYEQQHPSPDGKKVKLPTVKQLSAEYAEVLARKKQSYSEYRKGKDEMRDYLTAQKIIETIVWRGAPTGADPKGIGDVSRLPARSVLDGHRWRPAPQQAFDRRWYRWFLLAKVILSFVCCLAY